MNIDVNQNSESPDNLSSIIIDGEAFDNLPNDLYIPPEALQIYLERFEGPLDLLLYLIRKAKFNILEIPMAELTRQYLHYVETMRSRNLNLAAEYLTMAAIMIDIKSKMLLPRPTLEILQEGDEGEDPRAELVKKLIEYEQIQKAAIQLDNLPQAGREFFWGQAESVFTENLIQPQVEINELVFVWQDLLTRIKARKHHEIETEPLSMREQMSMILKKLQTKGDKYTNFFEAIPEQTITHIVIGFVAILELARQKIIEIEQSQINSDQKIYQSILYIKLVGNQLSY